jgi:hypothetical protein
MARGILIRLVVPVQEEASGMTSRPLSFFWYFGNLRVQQWTGRSPYRVLDLVFIALCATIANAQTWVQIAAFARQRRDWLIRFCQLPRDENGAPITPSHDTLERLFKRLDPHAFGRCIGNWTAALGLKQVAIDGKTLRGSADQTKGLRALHLVSAWSAPGPRPTISVSPKWLSIPNPTKSLPSPNCCVCWNSKVLWSALMPWDVKRRLPVRSLNRAPIISCR